ncbi:MAG: cyclic nucleotide-binding domain-containing protein [Chloroflexi bacterium]|nr:cyclic nucleotide-binding domain-containing protein [Chloroflexota bacterium]MBV9597965.1 cyclic nucleotide-binding domain-containing protein [Chloroflexota bacterium]
MTSSARDRSSEGKFSVWDELHDLVDVVAYRPRLRDGLVWSKLRTVQGEDYVIVQNPQTATYIRLSPEDFFVFELMDGSRTVQELVVAYMLEFRKFALARIARIVVDLRFNQCLVDKPYATFQLLSRKVRRRTIGTFLDDYLGIFLNREFPIKGIDGILGKAYRAGIWILFTRPVVWLLALISAIGVPLFVYYMLSRQFSLFPGESIGQDIVGYYVSFLIIAVTHELSHAFTVKSCGRVVRRGGISIFYGFPGLFVDTQDIWMEGRLKRMAASWAGPYSGMIYAGVVGLVLTIAPEGSWSTPLRLFGSVALVANMFQLMPLIQLDGYFILMDWLEIPSLRKRALVFVQHDLWPKVWRRQHFNREERIFTIFGVLSAAYTVYAIYFAGLFWWNQASEAIQGAFLVPNLGSLLGLALVLLLIVPFVLAVLRRALNLGRSLVALAQQVSSSTRDRWRRQRLALLAQVPVLASLGKEQMQLLAGKVRQERVSSGAAVVRQGDRGDRFYLIQQGTAEVIVDGADRSEVVATLGPADYFGELALLRDAPRAATVRATSQLRLLSLRGSDFNRLLGPYVGAESELRPRLEERTELDALPLFEPLAPREKDLLLSRLRTRTYQPGEVVIHEGEAAGDFYCIRSGHVEVTRRGGATDEGEPRVATLGPMDFFGEVALLLHGRRNATVRAVDEVRLWILPGADFDDLLAHYFALDETLADTVRLRLPARQVLLNSAQRGNRGAAERELVPDVTLQSLSGQTCSLAEFRGSNVVLWLSRGLADPGCAEFAARLDAAAPLFETSRIHLVQVVPDSVTRTQAEWGSKGFKHLILCDPDKSAYVQFGLCATVVDMPGTLTDATLPSVGVGESHSWLRELKVVCGSDTLGSNIAMVLEGLILIDRSGAIRARRLTAASGPLPEPEVLLRRLSRAIA